MLIKVCTFLAQSKPAFFSVFIYFKQRRLGNLDKRSFFCQIKLIVMETPHPLLVLHWGRGSILKGMDAIIRNEPKDSYFKGVRVFVKIRKKSNATFLSSSPV